MKILFGVFDWGIGHATRDIPLIEKLLKKHKVHILSTGRALRILKDRFKGKCIYHDVPSLYHVYKTESSFKLSFVLSIPKFLKSLKSARKITEKIIQKEKFDIVISDCRYDVYDKMENSYLINHQLRFKAPIIVETILEIWLASRMKRYKYVLVPDFEEINLSGNLSHNLFFIKKDKIRYIGILSNITKINSKEDIDYFISLSGPDFTRINLEKKILGEISKLKGKIVIAGGNPDIEEKNLRKDLEFYSFLDPKQQNLMMNRAKFIIARGGYTTIMELAELNKKALLIPSPGQTEQEYLGRYLKKYFYSMHQSKLDLLKDIKKAKEFSGFKSPWKTKESVRRFIEILKL